MIVAYTRFGGSIEFDWQSKDLDRVVCALRVFENDAENYDAWAVFAQLAIRSRRKVSIFDRVEGLEWATDFYRELLGDSSNIQFLDRELGIKTAIDRSLYAKTLLRREFVD